ncbi:MAG TPA: DUF924 family protein [Steroidobacteraceae bacterium]|nr:DUF924 family protein [Steroidobacteraceae bacterium]
MEQARAVLDFWFGAGVRSPAVLDERLRFWFGNAADAPIRERFADLVRRAGAGELDAWADSPRRRLALILLCDQFPRNLYRGTALAFAQDAKALGLALSGMQVGADAALDPAERLFFYMPLQHAESRDAQDESVAAFRRLATEAPESLRDGFQAALRYAELHRSLIERFGRFPHRNRVLGRETTPEELAYLRGGETFGQST